MKQYRWKKVSYVYERSFKVLPASSEIGKPQQVKAKTAIVAQPTTNWGSSEVLQNVNFREIEYAGDSIQSVGADNSLPYTKQTWREASSYSVAEPTAKSAWGDEQRFRATFEQAAVGMAHVSPSGQWLQVNQKLCDIVGYTMAELLQRRCQDITHPEDLEADLEYVRQMLAGEIQSYSLEKRYIRKNSTIVWINLTVSLVRETNGEPKYFITVVEDISDRISTQELLQQSEARLAMALNTAYMGVWDWDILTGVETWSSEVEALFGLSPDSFTGKYEDFLSCIHPQDRELVKNAQIRTLEEGAEYQVEYRIIWPDNTVRWLTSRGNVLRDETGKAVRLTGVVMDITDRKQAEAGIHLLQTLTTAIAKAESFESALEVALRKVCVATNWDFGEAWTPHRETGVLRCRSACYDGTQRLEEFRRQSVDLAFPQHTGLPGRVWSTKQPEWVQDVSLQPGTLFFRAEIAKACGLKAGFGVPIVANDQVLAVLVFFMSESRAEDKRLVQLVSTVATQLGEVLQRKQMVEALRLAETKYRSIFENAIEGLFQTTPNGRYISANPAMARIYGYESPAALIAKVQDIQQLYVDPNRRLQLSQQLQQRDAVSGYESQVYRQDGRIVWIAENARAVRDDSGALLYYEGSVEDITARKQIEEQLRYNAFHDPLTGLPNRAWLMDRLVAAVKQAIQCPDYQFALLFVDIDRFKAINDSLGHRIGDQLLMAIASTLQSCLEPHDAVARLAGDEFIVILHNIHDISNAIGVAQKIQSAISSPIRVAGYEVFASASIGIALSSAVDSPCHDLLRHADLAMSHAKKLGKGHYAVFDTAMHEQAIARLQLENDLLWAVERQEFQLYYQPVVSLATGLLAGFEALVRWRHPTRGLVFPAKFISVAEETGLILSLGVWVLREACRQLRSWQKLSPSTPPLTMNVNLSCKQLVAPNLVEQVGEILQAYNLSGDCLKLEITESAIMENVEVATAALLQLKHLGLRASIDDFGTGYSSLSRLHAFPINTLKIDRSFISRIGNLGENSEIVRTIVRLAHNMNMDVVAEGVETRAQLSQLKALNCEYGQGYLFSKPIDSEAAGVLIKQQPQWV